MDRNGCVLYAGSFDKTLFPALCVGYLVVPPTLVDAFARAHALYGRNPPILSQLVLCDFIESGHFVRHVRRVVEAASGARLAHVEPISSFQISHAVPSGAVLGFAAYSPSVLRNAVERLAVAVDDLSNGRLPVAGRGGPAGTSHAALLARQPALLALRQRPLSLAGNR